MQKVRVAQNSFQFGEVSDSLVMRTDTAVYPASAQRVENMVVTAEGSLKKRYGLKHIYDYGLRYVASDGTGTADDDGITLLFTNDGSTTNMPLDGVFVSGGVASFGDAGRFITFYIENNAAPGFGPPAGLLDVTITGTDIYGLAQTEVIELDDGSSVLSYTSTKSFKTVTAVSINTAPTNFNLKVGVTATLDYINKEEQSHLFPFVFDQNEEYIISVEHLRVRCFRLLTDGTVSLVATLTQDTSAAALPFDEDYLKQYTATQRGDVMWICHPLFAPRLLTRTSLTTFELSTYTFDQRLDNSVTFQPYSKFQSQGVTLDPSATTGTGITLTTSTAYWDTTGTQTAGNYLDSLHVGVTVRYSGNEITITSVQSATQATGDVVDELSTRLSVLNPLRTIDGSATVEVTMLAHGFSGGESITISNASSVGGINTGQLNGARTVNGIIDENTFTFTAGGSASSAADGGGYVTITTHSPTANWDEQSFSAKRGYPAAVTFHENRLVYGGTIAEPDALWFSKIGEYFNFDVGEAADADSINLIAATGDVNEIRYLISNRDLQVFTASSELYVPTYLNQAITPTNAQIRKQTPFGTEFVKPVEIDGATIFCELNGKIIREYLYTDAEDAYSSVAISTIASHLINTPKYAAVAHSGFGLPDSYAAFTMTNGEMVLFTSNRAERRAAWTRVTTAGTFGSVCAIEDRIFANVYDSDGNLQLCEFDTEVGLDFWLYNSITEASSNLSNASYDSIALDISAQDATPSGLFFKPDGTRLYITGTTDDNVDEFSLSTAWDLSTASLVQTLTGMGSNPNNLFFKSDGTKLYSVRTAVISERTLSTAWDISTAAAEVTFSVSIFDTSPSGLFFKPDGTKVFITGVLNTSAFEFTLSTAWDISTASYSQTLDLSSQPYDSPLDVKFTSDGKKMFILGTFLSPSSEDSVYQYSLSTAWDISTASYDNISFSVNSQGSTGQAIFFKSDDLKMYYVDSGNARIYQYSTPTHLIDVSSVYTSGDSVDVIAIKNSTQYSLGAFTVNGSNQVDLSAYSAENYTHAYVGKKYTAKIITNAVDASMGGGPATGTPRGITNIVLDLKNANSVKVNSKKPSMAAGFTGKKEFRSLGYSRDPQITIEQDDPLTMQVNGIVTELII